MSDKLRDLVSKGQKAFGAKKFDLAAEAFSQAAGEYESLGNELNAAEMRNNLSVALLQGGKAQEAFEALTGTEQIFSTAGDTKREAMAIGNQAAALEAMGRVDEALQAYERSAGLFEQAGENEMRSVVLQSAAKLKLQRGKIVDSAVAMIGSVEATSRPTILQRFLKFLIRMKP
jgi:tetratricopeptide (TPR) repeat protein